MDTRDRMPGTKLAIAGAVAALLAVPLLLVYLLVYDRETQSETARASIAEGWGGPQRLAGPLLVLPYRTETTEMVKENGKDVTRTRTAWSELYLAPAALTLDTALNPERRARSIYQTIVYGAGTRGRAAFRLSTDLARLGIAPEQIAFERAELRFGVSDPRALRSDNRVTVDGTALTPQPGNGLAATGGSGFSVPFDARALTQRAVTADFTIGLRGHSRVALVPRAGRTEWSVHSSWPHPSFTGAFLPETRRIDGTGFAATYRISNLALGTTLMTTSDPGATVNDPATGTRNDAQAHAVQIELVQPVDIYSQVNRAVKYGFLFIGFTFLAFLMFDLIGGRGVSAVEYLLVGAGLVLFFVMLLAFAEVTGFAIAYLVAAAAIVGLLTAYSAAVLGSRMRALLVAALLAGLYGVLYVLLSLEDLSLLIGSLLLFAALAAMMYLTRHLDWGRAPAEAS